MKITKKFGIGFLTVGALLGWQLVADDRDDDAPKLKGYFHHEPWTGNSTAAGAPVNGGAAAASLAGSIPMSSYSFVSSKDNKTYSGTLVGSSPFVASLTSSTIPAIVVPLKITIGTTVFDPTALNSCDGNFSAMYRFQNSPLVVPTSLTFNGVNVGTAQFVDGFRRAEFWGQTKGSPAYTNPLSYKYVTTPVALTAGTNGTTYSTGCSQLGIISYSWISSQLSNTVIPQLTAAGTISPTSFVIFLVKNVVQSNANPPSVNNCCILGYHSAKGSPVQTYGIMDWDTTGDFGAGTQDGSISSHEIGEWMDDPLGTNPTPAWGNIGQVSGCQTNWEVGDPLSGTLMPPITLAGKAYHMQELGFFSWYFNKNGAVSVGTGGKFSSNGKFTGPSKACPTGGTY